MTETKFETLLLRQLVPSPTNPRKSFDVVKTTELAESIKEKGVLQPILVRAKGKQYEIVCGERRYRASCMVETMDKKRNTIPAIVRELSDQEVREMQLIENFQREDVHPMEEALAIKYAVETGQYNMEDLRHKVGKSITYIKQRMKLNSLTEDWQKLFFNGNINITTALQLSQFTADTQTQILEDEDEPIEDYLNNPENKIEFSKYQFNRYKGNLSDATFDLADENLVPSIGACTSCQFNTSCAQLFPDDATDARCTNVACFATKTDVFYKAQLQIAKEDPSIVFGSFQYGNETKETTQLVKEGFEVLSANTFTTLQHPDKPDFEDFKTEWIDENDGEMNGCEEAWLKELDRYNEEMKAYENDCNSGKYLKAFVVNGNNRGTYAYIKLNKNQAAAAGTKKIDATSDTLTVKDIEEEIVRIREREKRNKQLDENKIWEELNKHFNPFQNANLLKEELQQFERQAIVRTLYNKLNYSNKSHFRKLFSFKGNDYEGIKDFTLFDEVKFAQALRFFMLSELPPTALYQGYDYNAKECLVVAENYFPNVLADIKAKQKTATDKREANITKAITVLQTKRKALEAELKSKKPTPKKAAKKK